MKEQSKIYPYGFRIWMNQLTKVGNEMGIWNIFQPDCSKHLCFDSWLNYFMSGLSPKNAIIEDIKQGGE